MLRSRKTKPLVSILIATYNGMGTIRRAIESALSQSYPHLEIIVSPDDGSTYEELRRWCDSPRVRIIPPGRTPRSGAGAARNRAMDAADGDFFCALDADDYLTANYVEELIKFAYDEGIAVAPVRYLDQHGTVVRVPPIHPGMLTASGFGQLLCSIKPLAHRSLEVHYPDGFAQDVVHDAILLAKTGGVTAD